MDRPPLVLDEVLNMHGELFCGAVSRASITVTFSSFLKLKKKIRKKIFFGFNLVINTCYSGA